MLSPRPIHSLYVHVPFCAHKCEYCAFYSEASNGEIINRYVEAAARELEMLAPELKPDTIFFGGGTPSLLNVRQWRRILETMEKGGLLGAKEWTVECNPATVSAEKAALLRSFGVNRISMGVQSLDENLLDRLGRIHSREMVFKSYDILRAAGFTNINLDLMFAIPTQTMPMWRATLDEIIQLGPDHLSCYEVIYEEDTPLYAQLQAGEFSVDEDLACSMYDELIDVAASRGFMQYEVANFARNDTPGNVLIPSRACQHNVGYWRGRPNHAVGPSAAGFVDGIRYKNWSNTPLYCDQIEKGQRAIESREELPPLARAAEILAFGMRMNCGWGFEEFQEAVGYNLQLHWGADIQELAERGWLERTEDRIRLTRLGMRFADAAGQAFLRTPSELAESSIESTR